VKHSWVGHKAVYTRTEGMTGQQRMFTPPRHLILPLVLPDVRASPIFTMDYSIYLILTLVLTADFSVLLDGTHRFWLQIVPFTWFWHADFDCRSLEWGAGRVWPVSRGCLLLLGTWSYLRICRGSVLPYTRFCNCLLITITFYTLLTSLFCI
jgi:hypothetical protein